MLVRRITLTLSVTVLASLAAMKLTSPYTETYALPMWAYYGSAFLELTLASALCVRQLRPLAVRAMTFFFLVVISVTFVAKGDCG